MIQRRSQTYVLASLGAVASLLGCFAVSYATMAHAQVQTPRFYAHTPPALTIHTGCGTNCSSVVVSR